jgi:hypothetical protein
MILKDLFFVDRLMDYECANTLIIAFEGILQSVGNLDHIFLNFLGRVFLLPLSWSLDDGEQLLPWTGYLQHCLFDLVDHSGSNTGMIIIKLIKGSIWFERWLKLNCAAYNFALFKFINCMLKLGLTIALRRAFTTMPVLKKSHQFTEFELKQLLA